jgi:hypothetical protein
MTNRNWKPFISKRAKCDPSEMRLSLSADAELAMSLAAFHALRSPAAIKLFYDEPAGLIGIVPAEPDTPNTVRVRKRQRGTQRIATLGEFCTSFGIPRPKTTIRFPKPAFDPDGTLVLNYRRAVEDGAASSPGSQVRPQRFEI